MFVEEGVDVVSLEIIVALGSKLASVTLAPTLLLSEGSMESLSSFSRTVEATSLRGVSNRSSFELLPSASASPPPWACTSAKQTDTPLNTQASENKLSSKTYRFALQDEWHLHRNQLPYHKTGVRVFGDALSHDGHHTALTSEGKVRTGVRWSGSSSRCTCMAAGRHASYAWLLRETALATEKHRRGEIHRRTRVRKAVGGNSVRLTLRGHAGHAELFRETRLLVE